MSELDKLIAAVAAAPDDDGPLGVLGDHLADAGDVRGELIQVELLREHLRVSGGGGGRYDLYERAKALERRAVEAWTPRWLAERVTVSVELHRGVPAQLYATASSVSGCLARALDALPTIHTLHLRSYEALDVAVAREVAGTPALSRVRGLTYANTDSSPHALAALLAAPRWGALRSVHMPLQHHLDDGVVYALADNAAVASLRWLDLSASAVDDQGATALVESASRRALEHVNLADTRVGPPGVAVLGRLPALRSLDVSGLALIPETIAALGASSTLRSLQIYRVYLDDALTDALLAAPFPALTSLAISERRLRQRTAIADPALDRSVARLRERWPKTGGRGL